MHMSTTGTRDKIIIVIVLLIELWAFSGSFDKYFNHDSLFYITDYPRSWDELVKVFAQPDSARQYRPLTLAAAGIFVPLLGTNPWPYHWIPLLFHLVNTCLFYALARRLMPDSLSALAAVIFWGFHAVAGMTMYDITYLSDHMMALFGLISLILAVDSYRKNSPLRAALAALFYVAALLSKEAAVTFPLALLICLVVSELKASGTAATVQDVLKAAQRFAALILLFLALAAAYAGLLISWVHADRLYSQDPASAYSIDPLSGIAAKTRYLYWAFNLPDTLHINRAERNRFLALGLMGALLLVWGLDVLRRRFRLTPVEWGGWIWLVGMSVPAFLLSQRTAKWYLYVPVMGLALALGTLVGRLRNAMPRLKDAVGLILLTLFAVPVIFSSSAQTRSLLAVSDGAYQSDVLAACLSDFRESHPTLPNRVTLFFLPAHEADVLRLLSAAPIEHGQLFELAYPGTEVNARFAHRGDPLPADYRKRTDILILYYLDGHLHDVTGYYKQAGRLSIFLLPTFEKTIPPLMEKEPIGGWQLHAAHTGIQFADRGDVLPADYYQRAELWILQYLMGHFYDVTEYFKGRRRDPCVMRVITDLERAQAAVNRDEFYPSYDDFGTPGGGPVFFPTPEKDIVTQIGGSTVVIPLGKVPASARLRFDISWMYDMGDGGWAEAGIRVDGREDSLYRKYMNPNPRGKGFKWEEVSVDLSRYAGRQADLVFSCRNSAGKSTIADWLNWRDVVIESPQLKRPGC